MITRRDTKLCDDADVLGNTVVTVRSGVKVFQVDTSRVGTDGLREALMAKYGVKEN